jgi:hypothetical protein
MTEWDAAWLDKISKVVRLVAKDLIANDEAEISEVIRQRLFESIGREKVIMTVARQCPPSFDSAARSHPRSGTAWATS